MADLKWIKHDGGAMPVPGDAMIFMRCKDGYDNTGYSDGEAAQIFEDGDNWWSSPRDPDDLIVEYAIAMDASEPDPVTKPAHYASGAIECIDAIRSALTPEEFRGYCKGNMLKYAWRERGKNGDEDLRKAAVYAGFATEASDNG